jgi:hypothetical protein
MSPDSKRKYGTFVKEIKTNVSKKYFDKVAENMS